MSYGQPSPAADPAPTLSASIRLNLRGFSSHDEGHRMAAKAVECLQALSRVIDLASLEGLTIAQDYDDALTNLEEIFTPPPLVLIGDDEGDSGGVLATRPDGKIRHHIVLRMTALAGFSESSVGVFENALGALARQCARVDASACFDQAFPGFIFGPLPADTADARRRATYFSCWEAFSTAWLSAPFARNQSKWLEGQFLETLAVTRLRAAEALGVGFARVDPQSALLQVHSYYRVLLRDCAAHLGNIIGQQLSVADFPRSLHALEAHWFSDAYADMDVTLRHIASQMGRWPDLDLFEQIADIADGLAQTHAYAL
jgi:hypothetical protein